MNVIENIRVAIKCNKSSVDDDRKLLEEGELISNLNHQNIIRLTEMVNTNKVYLVFELMDGALYDIMYARNYRYDKEQAKPIIQQILNGLAYLHMNEIVHRDLKPENILFTQTSETYLTIKISDFGVAMNLAPNTLVKYRHAGTRNYLAPEIWLKSGYDNKIDIWVRKK